LYEPGQKGLINNPGTFALGLVTGDGTTYMLMIDNKSAWESWSQRTFENNTGEILNRLFQSMKRIYSIKGTAI
jgi:hypothetical protein